MFDPTDLPSRNTELPRSRFERPDETPEVDAEPESGTSCDLCKGTGWETRTDNDCTDCNGTGRYLTRADRRAMWAAYDAKRTQETR